MPRRHQPRPGRPRERAGAPGDPTPADSAVRDHLANERTYLAWLRTGMALLGLGFVVARLRLEVAGPTGPAPGSGPVVPLIGFGFAALGLLTVVFGTWRYLAVRRMIKRREFASLGGVVWVLAAAALAVAIGVLLYLAHQLG